LFKTIAGSDCADLARGSCPGIKSGRREEKS